MYFEFEGETHVARNLDTAPPVHIIALQHDTGWSMKELRDQVLAADYLGSILVAYLTLASIGHPRTWDSLLNTPMSEQAWKLRKAPGDEAIAAEGGDASDPQSSPSASDPGGEPQAAAKPKAKRGTPSSSRSRGSSGRSTAVSSR